MDLFARVRSTLDWFARGFGKLRLVGALARYRPNLRRVHRTSRRSHYHHSVSRQLAGISLVPLLAAILPCLALAVSVAAQPLDTYGCQTCSPQAQQFRNGDYSSLQGALTDPSCDCPFPNNVIPRSRLLPNGAWPRDIYRENLRAFRGSVGRVVQAVARGITPVLEALHSGSGRHPRGHLHPEELERLLATLSQAETRAQLGKYEYIAGRTPLHYGAFGRGPGIIRILLDNGSSVDAKDDDGRTPLLHAASLESFTTLQAAGSNIRTRADSGYTVLHRAAHVTDAATVEALIASGLDPQARTTSGWRPLHSAGSPETFEALRKAAADIHARTDSGYTVLHRAVLSLDAASVEALIADGLDPNAEMSDGLTPSLNAGSRETFNALLAGGANLAWIETVFASGGLEAVQGGKISPRVLDRAVHRVGRFSSASLVARLRAINPDFAEVPDSAWSTFPLYPLHYAAWRNDDPAMIAALSTSNVTATTRSGAGAPLHLAALSNANPAVIEALLAAGANVDVNSRQYGSFGPTPLYLAAVNASSGAAEIVSVLLEAGADVNGRDENGEDTGFAPLYGAAMAQNQDAMELLLAEGADVDVTGSSDHQSLLADVLGRGRYDCGYGPVADGLRAAGAVSWRTVGEERMPYVPGLPVVECETVSAEVQELIDSGADLDALDSQGFTALHRAAAEGKALDVAALATAGAYVNATTSGGRLTPLHVAVWRGADLATVRALIDAEADVDATDWTGQTALHRAARDSRTDPAVVAALLAAGADANARDNLWRTPLDYATRVDVNNAVVADLLRKAGGTCRSCVAP